VDRAAAGRLLCGPLLSRLRYGLDLSRDHNR
jgi:hypothetical protein